MRNLKSALLLGAIVAFGTSACTKPDGDAGKAEGTPAAAAKPTTVATVNGTKIDSQMRDLFIQAMTGQPASEATPEQREAMTDQLISMTLAAQAAEKQGLARDPETKARIDLTRMQILAEASTGKHMEGLTVTDEEIQQEYDEQVSKMPKEFKARHILVEDKAEAEAVIKELEGGADFAKLAKQRSKDPGSANNGGDLGWFTSQAMVKPFSDAVATLDQGAITKEPVETQFGWHVIQLEDTRAAQVPPLEDVKEQVRMLAQRKKLQEYLDGLRANAKIQKSN
jgi:peptidyl-prolyl cis-trans isomerase C